MKKKLKKPQFPRIYRGFTENPKTVPVLNVLKQMIIIFVFSAILVFILFVGFDLYKNYVFYNQIQAERQKLTHDIKLWESFLDKYKNYKEVYFQIAVREYELKNFDKTGQYLQKALLIDPNYQEAIKLQKLLEGK
jgi:tetratricopeptide (TPR) repeat protein